jgi:hypothetical protein
MSDQIADITMHCISMKILLMKIEKSCAINYLVWMV